MMKRSESMWVVVLLILGTVLGGSGLSPATAAPAKGSYPEKPITYVCHTTAGGASDMFTRDVARMLTAEKIIPVAVTVENKPGGSGAVAANFIRGQQGNPYYILNVGDAFVLGPLSDSTIPGYKDVTPIARLAYDATSIVVRADSKFKTIADLVNEAKKKPGMINAGVTTVAGFNHMTILVLEQKTGAKYNIINFTDAGESLTSLLGGHIDFITTEPNTAKNQARAGKVRILATVTDNRLQSLPDIPTLKEQGYDVVLYMHRGLVAPKNIPKEAETFLKDAMKKLINSAAWKEYVVKRELITSFAEGDEYVNGLENETKVKAELLKLVTRK
jgi:putative tricarboxylic transport membrane protein